MVEMAGGGWEKLKKGKKGRTFEMNKNGSSKKKKRPLHGATCWGDIDERDGLGSCLSGTYNQGTPD